MPALEGRKHETRDETENRDDWVPHPWLPDRSEHWTRHSRSRKKGRFAVKDAFGKELNIGDKVVYIKKVAGCSSNILLAKGTVTEIKGRVIKVTSHNYGVMSQSVMKLEK